MFTRVYNPIINEERKNFWNELSDIRGLWSDPWYHVILGENEKLPNKFDFYETLFEGH